MVVSRTLSGHPGSGQATDRAAGVASLTAPDGGRRSNPSAHGRVRTRRRNPVSSGSRTSNSVAARGL